jgi:O-antigen/teichoic acid export membrane protein
VRILAAERDALRASAEDLRSSQQEAGLAALIALAARASLASSDIEPNTILGTSSLDGVANETRSSQRSDATQGLGFGTSERKRMLHQLSARFHSDHLMRNSLYLTLSSGMQAALGFAFWIIMARLFDTEEVGRASSLISATGLIAYFALFGLNSTLVRFLPTARNRDSLITSAFVLVACAGCALGLVYIFSTPVLAPRLAFVARQPALAAGFVLLSMAAAVNLLTDSVFIASRKTGLCALTDGAIGGISKICLGLVLAGTGAYGLFCASAGSFAAAALISIVLTVAVLRWRPSFDGSFEALRPLLKFSGGNYVANAFNLVPTLVVPLIVLDRLGAKPAAYYFVSFQMATLLYSAVWAVEAAFLAEGSQAEADWRGVRRRSRRIAVILFVPGGAFLALSAHWVLLMFGSDYSSHGTTTLILLAVAVVPIAACNWSWTVLRLSGRLMTLVISSVAYSCAISGLAWILAPHGLAALTVAWPAGSAVAAVLTGLLSPLAPRKTSGRHRRKTSSQRYA